MALFNSSAASFYPTARMTRQSTPQSRSNRQNAAARTVNGRTLARRLLIQGSSPREAQTGYEPGMFLEDQPQISLDDPFGPGCEVSSRSQHDMTAIIQQQQGIITQLLKSQSDMNEKQSRIEKKIIEVEAAIQSTLTESPSSSTSTGGTPKRKRLVTRSVSVSMICYSNSIPYKGFDLPL